LLGFLIATFLGGAVSFTEVSLALTYRQKLKNEVASMRNAIENSLSVMRTSLDIHEIMQKLNNKENKKGKDDAVNAEYEVWAEYLIGHYYEDRYCADWDYDEDGRKYCDDWEYECKSFKNYPNIKKWQIDNEPFLNAFGECPPSNINLLAREIHLIKTLDNLRAEVKLVFKNKDLLIYEMK